MIHHRKEFCFFYEHLASFEKLSWYDVHEEVEKVNPKLATIINELSPNKQYPLYKGSYPFGSEILRNGIFYVPSNSGKLLPLNSNEIDKDIKSDLSYNILSNPVTLMLENTAETFVPFDDRIIPLYGLLTPGEVASIWRILNPKAAYVPAFKWCITAGARSLFLLPKISNSISHRRLQNEFDVQADIPRTLLDHWYVFREIANHPSLGDPWMARMLFFSKQWFSNFKDPAWASFYTYFLEKAWQGSEFWRNQFAWDLIFSAIHLDRKMVINPILSAIARHIFSISVGGAPGFEPATSNIGGPIDRIQSAYIDGPYSLKKYVPTVMQLSMFSMYNSQHPVYYSLKFPTSLGFSANTRQKPYVITDLFQLISLLKKYSLALKEEAFNLQSSPLYEVSNKVKFDYFHVESGPYKDIHATEKLFEGVESDPRFKKAIIESRNTEFASNSPFLKGCVRIKRKVAND